MKTKKLPTHDELNNALMATQDLMERLAGCQFFPQHNIAEVIYNEWVKPGGKFKSDAIYIGIREQEWTKSRQSMFNTLSEFLRYKIETTPKGYEIELQGVPVRIQIIKRNYKVFQNPDIKFWGVTEFFMPNPMDKYLKIQHLIK